MSSERAAAPLPRWVAAVHAASRAAGVFSAGLILLGVFVICQMVVVRMAGQSAIWQTEFTTFSLIAATFLGAPYIFLTRGHVAVDVVPLMVSTPARRVLHLAGSAITLVFVALVLYAAWPWWHEAWERNLTTPSIWRARLWIPYAAVPVGLALLLLQIIADAWCVARGHVLPFGLAEEDRL